MKILTTKPKTSSSSSTKSTSTGSSGYSSSIDYSQQLTNLMNTGSRDAGQIQSALTGYMNKTSTPEYSKYYNQSMVNDVNNYLSSLQPQVPLDTLSAQQEQPQSTIQADIYKAMEQQRLAALESAKKNALASLDQEQSKVNPTYNTALATVGGQSATNARNLQEYLAQRGQTQSGVAAQAEINRQSELMGAMGSIENERAAVLADIERRRTAAQTAYDEGALQAGLQRQIEEGQAILQAQQGADELNKQLELARLTSELSYNNAYRLNEQTHGYDSSAYAQKVQDSILAAQREYEQEAAMIRLRAALAASSSSGGGGGGGGAGAVKNNEPDREKALENIIKLVAQGMTWEEAERRVYGTLGISTGASSGYTEQQIMDALSVSNNSSKEAVVARAKALEYNGADPAIIQKALSRWGIQF